MAEMPIKIPVVSTGTEILATVQVSMEAATTQTVKVMRYTATDQVIALTTNLIEQLTGSSFLELNG